MGETASESQWKGEGKGMYASLWNQLYHVAHFLFSFLLLMVVVPKFLFPKRTMAASEDRSDRLVSRYMRIVFFYIVMGYLLVLTNLFEVLSVVAILLLLIFRHYLRKQAVESRRQAKTFVALLFYEMLDLGFRLKKTIPQALERLRTAGYGLWKTVEARQLLMPRVLLLVVLLISAYLRFDDAMRTAAPSMSDGYVTLSWMKYLEERIFQHHDALFHDGIYPQGFHLTLALVHKFAAIDALYVLRYMGPLDGVLMTFGLYYATSRWSGNRYAGIVAAALFGLGGYVLQGADWDRQAATNSQEFAMVVAYPTFLYLGRFMQKGNRADLWTGAAGVAITGLVHTLLFAYVGMGMGVLLLVSLLFQPRELKRVWHLVLVGVGSVVIAVIPFGIGKLLGRDVNTSSEDFLTSKVTVTPPDLHVWDKASLVGLFLVLLWFLLSRKPFRERLMPAFACGLIISTFLLYEYGATYTHNEVLAARSQTLWNLTVPFALGLGVYVVSRVLRKVPGQQFLLAAVCVGVMVLMYRETHFAPIAAYKMEWESGVEQVLKIAANSPEKSWMFVSDHTEAYDEVLGKGYHMYIDKQTPTDTTVNLMDYDPALPAFTKRGQSSIDKNMPNDVYIYLEKHIFEVAKSNNIYAKLAPEYQNRKKEQRELIAWLATYKQHHNDLQVYDEDENICIYHIHRDEDADQRQQQIWGGTN